jgi:hypothetical protein
VSATLPPARWPVTCDERSTTVRFCDDCLQRGAALHHFLGTGLLFESPPPTTPLAGRPPQIPQSDEHGRPDTRRGPLHARGPAKVRPREADPSLPTSRCGTRAPLAKRARSAAQHTPSSVEERAEVVAQERDHVVMDGRQQQPPRNRDPTTGRTRAAPALAGLRCFGHSSLANLFAMELVAGGSPGVPPPGLGAASLYLQSALRARPIRATAALRGRGSATARRSRRKEKCSKIGSWERIQACVASFGSRRRREPGSEVALVAVPLLSRPSCLRRRRRVMGQVRHTLGAGASTLNRRLNRPADAMLE